MFDKSGRANLGQTDIPIFQTAVFDVKPGQVVIVNGTSGITGAQSPVEVAACLINEAGTISAPFHMPISTASMPTVTPFMYHFVNVPEGRYTAGVCYRTGDATSLSYNPQYISVMVAQL